MDQLDDLLIDNLLPPFPPVPPVIPSAVVGLLGSTKVVQAHLRSVGLEAHEAGVFCRNFHPQHITALTIMTRDMVMERGPKCSI